MSGCTGILGQVANSPGVSYMFIVCRSSCFRFIFTVFMVTDSSRFCWFCGFRFIC